MGYRKIDPRTKAAAVKAMRKAVDSGSSAHAAARELAPKYGVAATTLQTYYTDATADEGAEANRPTTVVTSRRASAAAEAADEPSAAVAVREDNSITATDEITGDALASADALADDFTATLQALSEKFIKQLQAAALEDLVAKMQDLHSQLPRS